MRVYWEVTLLIRSPVLCLGVPERVGRGGPHHRQAGRRLQEQKQNDYSFISFAKKQSWICMQLEIACFFLLF